MSPVPALVLLAGAASFALLADRAWIAAAVAAALLVVALRAPARRRWPYLIGALGSAATVLLLTPWVEVIGSHPLWTGPTVPVLGTLDVTTEELHNAFFAASQLAAVGLAFSVYALLLDHDRLLAAAGYARRSALAVALATRLVPTLEHDAARLVEALRGRGVTVAGARGRAKLLSPLLAGSLDRGLALAEAMEARGYGRPGRTRAPRPPWRTADFAAVAAGPVFVLVGALWL